MVLTGQAHGKLLLFGEHAVVHGFAATGLTDGALLRGVRFDREGARTQSVVMRSRSGTVRMIDARHKFDKLRDFAAIDY